MKLRLIKSRNDRSSMYWRWRWPSWRWPSRAWPVRSSIVWSPTLTATSFCRAIGNRKLAFEAFANARDPDSFTSAERNAALDRLIDQELLREQVRPSQPAPAEQVAARVAEVQTSCIRIVAPTRVARQAATLWVDRKRAGETSGR